MRQVAEYKICAITLLACLTMLGCSGMVAPISISPQDASVRIGQNLSLTGMQNGVSIGGGLWSVSGGSANGVISPTGVFTPPPIVPAGAVTITYQLAGQTAVTQISILNPTPVIEQVSPGTIIQVNTMLQITGSGFVTGSQLLVAGLPVATTVLDSEHLSASVIVTNLQGASLAMAVSNPSPGPTIGSSISVPVAIAPVTVLPQTAAVRIGGYLTLSGLQQGNVLSGGTWSIAGGPANGSISADGVYSPPSALPMSNVTVTYLALGQTASSTISVLNPLPVISAFTPSTLIQVSNPVTLTGTGFITGSQILVGDSPIPTTFVDAKHLSGTIDVASLSTTAISVSVANPSPGAIVSAQASLPVAVAPLTVSPSSASVRIGSSLALKGMQQGDVITGGTWSVLGGQANGNIGDDGIYRPPSTVPASGVSVAYSALGQTASTTISVLNPVPSITEISPPALLELTSVVIVVGDGFVSGSQIIAGGLPLKTSFIDAGHLTATVVIPKLSVTSETLEVSNPSPGAIFSQPTTVPVTISSLTISPQGASVRLGSTLGLSGLQASASVTGGVWTVTGGDANGTIDSNGTYSPPATISQSIVTVNYQAVGQTASSSITLLNAVPVIKDVTPSPLNQITNLVNITGSGFVAGSSILVEDVPVKTRFIDENHLSATIILSKSSTSSLAVAVSNPNPGAVTGAIDNVPVEIVPMTVIPAILSGGNITVSATLAGLPPNSVLTLNNVALSTVSSDANSITATGYLPFWKSDSVSIGVASSVKSDPYAELDVPIAKTAVPYDVASRFAMQAGFGPRHDIIEHIQQIGLEPFIDEQFQVAPDTYLDPGSALHNFLLYAANNNTQLRLRTAWAFQSFMPGRAIFVDESAIPWEKTLEADAFGNFRQILLDVTSDPNVTTLLNLPGNSVSIDPKVHPNQNFARELLQLFSIGSIMINDDGTTQVDSSGNPLSAYEQDTILDLSRALTGWTYASPVNSTFTFYGIDYSQPLVPDEEHHDTGSKIIFRNVLVAAGQDATTDRNQVLDAVFQHQNVPAFVSRRLIQRFVKSQPSPAYLARISAVFKDDGSGVRGNLAAVIKAILLDPEARAGDNAPSADDGYVQDPLFAQIFATELLGIQASNDVPGYYPAQLGEPFWYSPTVFAYYSPDYVVPGTALVSPESQLLTTTLIVQRSQFLWGMVNGPQAGYEPWGSSWLSTTFPTVPAMVDALNHIMYHGTMSAFEQGTISNYCGAMPDQPTQLRCTLQLALNADSYTVVQ